MSHPVVEKLTALNPEDGSLVIFRVPENAKRAFMSGCGQSIGRWIEQTQRFKTCVLLLSDDAQIDALHPRSVLEILERQPKETVEKVMEAWRIAHSLAPDDANLAGLMELQQQMSKVIDAAMQMKEAVEKTAEEEGRSWPYGSEIYEDGKLPFDRELEALQTLVESVPTQHLAPDEEAQPEPKETPPAAMPEDCAVCNAPNRRYGQTYECRNGHSPLDQIRAQRVKQLESEH